MTHDFTQGEDKPPTQDRRMADLKLIELNHRIDKLADKVTSLHENHTEHKKELSDLSQAVSKLSNTINRAIWILVGGAAVIAFLSSGQFTQTVNTGSAIVGSQNGGR
jgi:NAD+--asparagine ADP-ribosyltransferase